MAAEGGMLSGTPLTSGGSPSSSMLSESVRSIMPLKNRLMNSVSVESTTWVTWAS